MKKTIFNLTRLFFLSLVFVACSDNDDTQSEEQLNALYTQVIENTANNVIIKTYENLNNKALTLKSAINALVSETTEENLHVAKNAWVETRAPWEQSESFLYGPVDFEGLDPALDTWPVDVEAMNNILNSGQPITPAVIEANDEARGFHLIEFLLWGENGETTASDLADRQLEYLAAAAQDLQNNTQALYDGWITSGGNYVQNFLNAGNGQNPYPSQKSALEEFVDGIIIIADEVANGKIEDPLNPDGGTPNPELEESRFSNNSKLDFANNIRSIQNIYLGDYSNNGKGLTDIVSESNATLDQAFKTAVNEAIAAIEAIPGTFTEAIFNNREEVIFAQNKVRAILEIAESQLKPYINGL